MRRWFLGTPLPDSLAEEGHTLVTFLRSDAPDREKAERAFRFIYAVGGEALAYHFHQPLERLGVGAGMRRTVDLATAIALKGMRAPMRHVLYGMTTEQLRGVADEIEFRLYPDPHAK